MAGLEQLMRLPGALAAFTFSDLGELQDHHVAEGTQLNASVLDLLCHVCVANTAIATMQARGWQTLTGAEGFYPIQGFTLIGFDWSAITCGHTGLVVANDQADYEAAYALLGETSGQPC
jgi:roadblock/LC7 domain-containing protein